MVKPSTSVDFRHDRMASLKFWAQSFGGLLLESTAREARRNLNGFAPQKFCTP